MIVGSIILLTLVFGRFSVLARCPNDCSQKGVCSSDNACICNTGYTYPDCSGSMYIIVPIIFHILINLIVHVVICPNATAWVGKAQSLNTAHSVMECANRGYCDRKSVHCLF